MQSDIDFGSVFAASPHPYLLMTPEFTVVAANQAYLRTVRCSVAAIKDRNLFDAFPLSDGAPAPRRELRDSLERVVATRAPDSVALISYPMIQAGSAPGKLEERFWSITHTPVLGRTGELVYVLHHAEDVTELHRANGRGNNPYDTATLQLESSMLDRARQVQETNRLLYAERLHLLRLFEEAPGFICFLRGPDHVFELANRAFFQLIGPREAVGRPLQEALPELAGQGLLEVVDHVYAGGRAYVGSGMQLQLQRAENAALETVHVDLVLQPIVEVDGNVAGILVQGNDVTPQLQAQLELRRYRERLEDLVVERTRALQQSETERRKAEEALFQAQKLEALGKLTGGVAHDFNNVLQLIAGNLELLLREADTPTKEARIKAALNGVANGGRLASQLLTFARRQPLTPRVVDIGALLAEQQGLLQQAAGVGVRVELAVNAVQPNVRIDPHQLETMLINLALNARDAIRSAGERNGMVRIEVDNEQLDSATSSIANVPDGDYLRLRIVDNGCGMSNTVQQQAFEPFFTTKSGSGTGLGLSLVYGFVGQSGGHVELTSAEGAGTTVSIWLPLCGEACAMPTPADPQAAAPRGSETVLLVEHETAVRAITTELLMDLGYRVIACGDCVEAVERLKAGVRPQLLLTEMAVPGPVSPIALIERARALLPAVAVVLLSSQARVLPPDVDYPSDVGLLAKPFDSDTLAHRLRQALHGGSAHARYMPVAAAASEPPVQAPVRTEAAVPSPGGAGPRVLLVEDDTSLRRLTAECLSQLGCTVAACASSEEALHRAQQEEFDLLFTDVNLVGVSGVELARELSARRPSLRVVLASGEGQLDLPVERAVFLHKPYDLKQLQEVLVEPVAT